MQQLKKGARSKTAATPKEGEDTRQGLQENRRPGDRKVYSRVFDMIECAYRRVYRSLLHTGVRNHVFTTFAWLRIPTADVPLPLGSRTVSGFSYQLRTATAHNH
jgi:hypothetical protein